MANPVLSKGFEERAAASTAVVDAGAYIPEVAVLDGSGAMTIAGTGRATAILLAILVGGGVWGWTLVSSGATSTPGWILAAVLGGLGIAIVTIFKPQWARVTAPLYAGVEGVVLGGISRVYESAWDGIVVQAVMATVIVLLVMLVLYVTRTIRVTDKTRALIIGATLGIAVFYLVSLLLAVFGVQMPFVWDTGVLGIGFSVFVIAVAAFNLLLDFDLIERGVTRRAPAYMEWYAAFGLLVTLVWLYLEILRLLSKLNSR